MNQPSSVQPYIGLRPFTENERDRFFGRSREISILLDKIRANRLTLLLAASGVGKSSLLQAGIMPALRTDGSAELIYHRDWAASPQEFKRAVSAHYDAPDKDIPLQSLLRACTLFTSGQQIILLDQFEEFFNYQRFKAEFLPFVAELSAAILDRRLPASFVISMREDFALELNAFKPFLPGMFDNYFRLEKLTREQARQAIEEPLKPTGWCFEPEQDGKAGLLEQVLNDLAKREQERQFGVQELLALKELPLLVEPPHLQIVCRELWEKHRDESRKQITWAAYEQAERAEGILKTYFLGTISQFSQREQVLASAAFDHLIGQRATKVAHPLERLAELTRADAAALKPVLDRLQDSAVLRRQKRGEEFWYELYHDIFSESIDAWNRDFKYRQRRKKLACGSVAALLAGGLLFAGNNWQANYYGRYLQLGTADGDRVEVYRGTLNGWDVFHQRKFFYEMPFIRRKMEPDKLFYRTTITEKTLFNQEIIGRLPISDRLPDYMRCGFYQPGFYLANRIKSIKNSELLLKQIGQLSLVRSYKTVQELIFLLDQNNEAETFPAVIQVLATLHADKAIPNIKEAFKKGNFSVQAAVVNTLATFQDNDLSHYLDNIIKQFDKDDYQLRLIHIPYQEQTASAIKQLLVDQNANTRTVAIKILSLFRSNEFYNDVINLLKDENPSVREAAIEFLESTQDEKLISEIRKFIADGEPYVQAAAIKALGVLHDKEMLPEIRKFISDRDVNVRTSVIKYLESLHDKSEAHLILNKISQSRDTNERDAAIEYVSSLQLKESLGDILKMLTTGRDWWKKRTAIKAATRLHDTGSLFYIKKLFFDNWMISGEALDSLAAFRDEESIPAIRSNLLFSYYWNKSATIKALATLHDSKSISEIRNLVSAEDYSAQAAAVAALGDFHDQEAIAEIRRFLDNGDLTLQAAAINALGVLHDSGAGPAIRGLIGKGDWKAQEAAIRALGMLHDKEAIPAINERLADRYIEIQLAAAQALARLDHSSPQLLAWQQKKIVEALEKAGLEYPDERTEAARNLSSIFTPQSVELLDKLMDDAEKSVVMQAVESLGIIGEYAPRLVQQQIPKLLALTNHDHSDMQEAAVNALGRLISFRGKEKAVDFSETDQEIRSAFRAFILDQKPKNSFRRTVAIDVLGATGRQKCVSDFESLLNELKKADDNRYYRCLYWMKRLETDGSSGDVLKEKLQKELDELTARKELWRQKRDQKQDASSLTDATFASSAEQDKDAWRMEPMEHLLGSALARIDSEKTGINLLHHPLYQVRQGAIRALAAKANASLIDKIIQEHQNFNPDDLPLPFPYAAFQAIDLSLWNLEYTGTGNDLNIIRKMKLEPCKIPGQEGAIQERLEWTIKRLEERFSKQAAAPFDSAQGAYQRSTLRQTEKVS